MAGAGRKNNLIQRLAFFFALAKLMRIAGRPEPVSQYVGANVIRYPRCISQRETNGTGLRVRATLTM